MFQFVLIRTKVAVFTYAMIETMLTIIVENHVDFAKKIYITYNLSINIGFVISKLQAI